LEDIDDYPYSEMETASIRREAASNIPTRKYGSEALEDSTEKCPICWEDFTTRITVKELPCGHIFHPNCIDEWLKGYNLMCPYCKKDIREQN
jgi:hypothetical protein